MKANGFTLVTCWEIVVLSTVNKEFLLSLVLQDNPNGYR